jgi:hypothetical protein
MTVGLYMNEEKWSRGQPSSSTMHTPAAAGLTFQNTWRARAALGPYWYSTYGASQNLQNNRSPALSSRKVSQIIHFNQGHNPRVLPLFQPGYMQLKTGSRWGGAGRPPSASRAWSRAAVPRGLPRAVRAARTSLLKHR